MMPLYTSVNNTMTDVIKETFLMMMCPHPVGFFFEFQVVTAVAGFLLTVALFTGFQIVTVASFTGFQVITAVGFLLAVARSCKSLEPSSSLLTSPALWRPWFL